MGTPACTGATDVTVADPKPAAAMETGAVPSETATLTALADGVFLLLGLPLGLLPPPGDKSLSSNSNLGADMWTFGSDSGRSHGSSSPTQKSAPSPHGSCAFGKTSGPPAIILVGEASPLCGAKLSKAAGAVAWPVAPLKMPVGKTTVGALLTAVSPPIAMFVMDGTFVIPTTGTPPPWNVLDAVAGNPERVGHGDGPLLPIAAIGS